MFQDEDLIKLHAAGFDDDDADEVSDLDSIDEDDEDDEEEEVELDVPASHHAEEADLYAAPSTPVDPYEPPTKLADEPPRPFAAGSANSATSFCISRLTSRAIFPREPTITPKAHISAAKRSRWVCQGASG